MTVIKDFGTWRIEFFIVDHAVIGPGGNSQINFNFNRAGKVRSISDTFHVDDILSADNIGCIIMNQSGASPNSVINTGVEVIGLRSAVINGAGAVRAVQHYITVIIDK